MGAATLISYNSLKKLGLFSFITCTNLSMTDSKYLRYCFEPKTWWLNRVKPELANFMHMYLDQQCLYQCYFHIQYCSVNRMVPLINSYTSFNSTVDIIAQSFLCGREIPIALSLPPHIHTTTTVMKALTAAILVCLVFLHHNTWEQENTIFHSI